MTRTLKRAFAGSATVALVALGTAAPALACHGPNGQQQSHNASYVAPAALTGSTLTSASTAATNATGGTVTKATTAPDSRISNAAYKVHVTKTDGSHAIVIEDSNFNVLAVKNAGNCGGHAGTAGNGAPSTAGAAYAGHLRHRHHHHGGWSH